MTEQDIINKYGVPGSNLVYCTLPYKMKLAWDTNMTVSKFYCHKSVKEKLEDIFEETLGYYGALAIKDLGLDMFGGCFQIRPKTSGKKLSLHSWGLAVDIDPINNQYSFDNKKAKLSKPEFKTFWNIVENHSGVSLGKLKNKDWMHFQFVKGY